jgi:uncharacterized protein
MSRLKNCHYLTFLLYDTIITTKKPRIHNLKRRFFFLFIILPITFHFFATTAQSADAIPRPRGAINDFANVISPQQERSMELISREVFQKTGTSVVVATIESIGDNDPSDYTNRLYETWGIGKKGEDKGVLIFLALKERRIRIETGYGVEGILPDGLTGSILDSYVLPYLEKNDYDSGMANALIAVSQVIVKDAGVSLTGSPARPRQQYPARRSPQINLFSLVMFLVVISLLLGTRQGRRMLPFILLMLMMGGRGGAGGFGGFSGGFGGFGGGLSGGGGAGRGF